MGKYICEECGHASGYHKDNGDYFGKCMIIDCKCKEFIWSNRNYKQYKRINEDVSSKWRTMECECRNCRMVKNIKITKSERKMLDQIKLASEIVMIEDRKLLEELAKH